ncbi:LLM class F420-dependent oxidoreductase [Actinoplanes philippinensis]|uniref:Probable F420-dependent oxidoreductase, Rv3520c family n=1 Tax=Actinoplanes philippinensis TaxID=35752 RepID=A0A1I1ZY49_9ACTN|nr:LLM class F420-dependent oxidoreductase [Actinoplanes philippinensis]GIE75208.1 LLM class F420-dependent oxidoreductase [Actinoplanes philippinensis]SFE36774.1 probable F420-dependent oxidoreductase, Rv3520c family [Actinoplanes philippinensis]
MRLGVQLGYSGEGFASAVDEVVEFEKAGVDLVVVPEAYSFDAVSQLGYLAARTRAMDLASGVMQLYTRTPTLTAMTAAGLDHVSGGRFNLGLGASGPQVIEGFHGVRYDAPIARTREIVEICRRVWRRETLTFDGGHYRIPLPGDYAKPLKLINHPVRPRVPILLAAMGPRNVALAAEIAEGWQALWLDPRSAARVFGESLADGRSRRDPALPPLDVSVPVPFVLGDPGPDLLARHRAQLALYLGGMGARGRNFSNDLVRRYGYAEEATRIQDLYLSGRRAEAIAAVPGDLVTATSLAGRPDDVRRGLDALAEAGVTTVLASPLAPTRAERVAQMAELRALLP